MFGGEIPASVTAGQWMLVTIVGFVLVAIPATVAAVAAWQARRHAIEINDGVNHRHLRDIGEGPPPRLFDLALESWQETKELSQRVGLLESRTGRMESRQELMAAQLDHVCQMDRPLPAAPAGGE